jgi:hypothetical protein
MSLTALYESPGKRAFRELVLAVAKRDECQTYGTFWGSGIDSRMAVDAGLEVTAAEIVRALHPAMDADAAEHGYRAFHGRASRLTDRFDVFCADFCGNASPVAFRELGHIAALTDKWLAVVLTPDHQLNSSMQGEAALFTVPAWLTGASGFTLEYFTRYRRNGRGGVMFAALLRHRQGHGNSHRVQPLQIARSVAARGYWASKPFHETRLLTHAQPMPSERTVAQRAEYYTANRERKLSQAREGYQRRKHNPDAIARDRAHTAEWAKSEKGRAWRKAFDKKRRTDPERGARIREYQREYHRAWVARKKATAVSGTAAEAIEKAA